MTSPRFLPPLAGAATPVRLPRIARDDLSSGLRVWSLPWTSVPVVAVALIFDRGTAQDPAARPGLAGLTADLLDEGAGGRESAQLADAFARLGTDLEIDVGHDMAALSFTTLARNLDAALALVADVVMRPHLAEPDFRRIVDLRRNRLTQLTTSASAAADRAFLSGVFGGHAYGHGPLGTTRALDAVTLADVRTFYGQMFVPESATLIVAGDVDHASIAASTRARFGDWRSAARQSVRSIGIPEPAVPRLLLVDRPGAPQSELRIGHLGPARQSVAYHALITLNAALGGQFTSRINQHLREAKGYTYGARTAIDFLHTCSMFACNTSVQSDATADAIADILAEFEAVRSTRPVAADELDRARSSLTRGYVKNFETPAHLVRAAAELVKFSLPDDTFDRFVPAVDHLDAADVLEAARQFVHPDACVTVVVGDAEKCRPGLSRLGREIVEMTPEF